MVFRNAKDTLNSIDLYLHKMVELGYRNYHQVLKIEEDEKVLLISIKNI